ncbi:hypothetical protein KJ885_02345 [Patescibacteria group bacterium]|nr:hypothetical protein [Patescibacteria group bacterium]
MLAVGGVLFWILLSVVCLLLIVAVEFERPGWATVSVIATFLLLGFFGDFNVWLAVKGNPLIALGFFFAYVVVGVLWSFGKWWFFVRNKRDEYEECKARFLRDKGIENTSVVPDNLKKEWSQQFGRYATRDYYGGKPKARENKARILTWMIYWPWSMFWTLINDPIKRFFKFIYERLQKVYQKIADSVYKGVEDDFLPPGAPLDDELPFSPLERGEEIPLPDDTQKPRGGAPAK